jgi:uncharacterized OB-fold protein
MSTIAAVGTYLPPWTDGGTRVAGPDEDAVTCGVAAGRAALTSAGADRIAAAGTTTAEAGRVAAAGTAAVRRVIFVTRDVPLLEGGNGAALLAGLGLEPRVTVIEQVGGATAALDAVADSAPGTLVVAADCPPGGPAGAAAVLTGVPGSGPEVSPAGQVTRSLPVRARAADGVVHDYDDPRLLRERGAAAAIGQLQLAAKPDVVAGLPARQAAALGAGQPPSLPTTGASAALFALASLADLASPSPALVLAVDQASASAVTVSGAPAVHRDEWAAQPLPRATLNPGPEIALSLAAYERAFEPKLRWEAARCDGCGTLAFPPRYRCLECGSEARWTLVALPRRGEVYTVATIRVAVPGLRTPYSLAIVQLDGVDVRALVQVTGVPAGSATIGDRGTLVLRRVAVRSGVPDYGYALLPDSLADQEPDSPAAQQEVV